MLIFNRRDLVLDGILLVFLSISLLSLFTISEYYFRQQLIYASLGLILYILIPLVSLNWYKFFYPVFYLVILMSLIYLYAFGQSVRGAVSWIDLGVFNFQPSEFSKFIVIFGLSLILSGTKQLLGKLLIVFAVFLPLVFFIFIQPDLGTVLVLLFCIFFILFTLIFTPRQIFIYSIILIVLFGFSYNFLQPYQKQRITSFLNPSSDALGSGYNVIQAQTAIGSAGMWGKGFMQNTQVMLNFLPESHTDFIFAGATEAYGIIYSIGVVAFFTFVMYWLLNNYIFKSTSRFILIFSMGVFSILFFQFVLNIGMNLGILPITGLTLPLISYGGSSLLLFVILLGFLQLFNIDA